MYRARKLILTLFALLIVIGVAFAQGSGKIVGSIIDKENGEGLIGANVYLDGTEFGSVTDFDGTYVIVGIPDGNYVLVVSYIGYNEIRIQNVVLAGGNTQKYDLAMETESFETDVLVVEAEAVTNSEASLLKLRQKATSVSDAISAEEISKSGSGDAAAAMKKVTGASVVGGKYVYVRGLGDRYTSTTLNGATVPSADPDKNSFQMDLIPSSMLENINTQKTFTPDKPGTFTGGLVDVRLKDYPEDFTLTVNSSLGHNAVATENEAFIIGPRGGTDWLGFDDGTRELPSEIKNLNERLPTSLGYLDDIAEEQGIEAAAAEAMRLDKIYNSFSPNMYPKGSYAPYNGSFGISLGNTYWFDDQKNSLGYFASLTYDRSVSLYENAEVGNYKLTGDYDVVSILDEEYYGTGQRGSIEAKWGIITNIAYKNVDFGKVKFSLMRNQSGENMGQYYEIQRERDAENQKFETYVSKWTERALASYQLDGEHVFPALWNIKLDWLASMSTSTQDEPDARYFFNIYTLSETRKVYGFDGANSQPFTRFFRDLQEDNSTLNINLELPFEQWSGLKAKIKTGFSHSTTQREYDQLRYTYDNNNLRFAFYGGDQDSIFGGDIDSLFEDVGLIPEKMDTEEDPSDWFGLLMSNTQLPINFFRADMHINAYYAMIDLPLLYDLRFIGGVRFESTILNSKTLDPSQPKGRIDQVDVLPSFNLIYALQENMNLRGVYTQTIGRPTFREIAPYETFEFQGDLFFEGNENLRMARITNLDLRWEWFFNPGEIVAVSAFYKRFVDPIQRTIDQGRAGDNLVYTVFNAPVAKVQGLEFEFRYGFGIIDNWLGYNTGVFTDIKLGSNLSLVDSKVNRTEAEKQEDRDNGKSNPDDTRPFAGQSPVLLNINLSYDNYESKTTAGLYYNFFGDRLYQITRQGTPDIYERGYGSLDFKASQGIGEQFSISLSIKNILNPDEIFSYRLDNGVVNKDYVFRKIKRGVTTSLSVAFKL